MKCLYSILLISFAFLNSSVLSAEPFRIYGAGFTGADSSTEFHRKTLEAIHRAVYPREVVVYSTDWKGLEKAVNNREADLVIAGAAAYRRNVHAGLRDLMTAVTPLNPDPNHAMGSVIYVLNEDERISSIKDLKGKILGTNKPGGFLGELTVLKEVHDNGFDPGNFFRSVKYFGDDVNERIRALEDGRVDAIVLNACFAERRKALGQPDLTAGLRVVNEKKNPYSACKTSTVLYPGYSILVTPRLSVSEVNRISQELEAAAREMPPGYGWKIASDFTLMDNLYRDLKIGPFHYLGTPSVREFWAQYRYYFLFALSALVLYLLHSVRIAFLVNKRTLQLRSAYDRERELKDKIQTIHGKYQAIRTRQEISQLCSAVAHDLSQPLSSILLFADTLRSLLIKRASQQEESLQKEISAVNKILLRAGKLNDIVQLVREFASGNTQLENHFFDQIIRSAAEDFCALNHIDPMQVKCDLGEDPLTIYCSSDQWELALMNLLNNSFRAASLGKQPRVFLSLRRCGKRAHLKIWDSGPRVSEEKLAEVRDRSRQKIRIQKEGTGHGLGLGLSIVASVVALHSGTMSFDQSPLGGLAVLIEIPLTGSNGV